MTDDGWIRTGDAGFLDADGYLFIHDRMKDMIITGGENVYPAEVESAIFGHPAVQEVAVFGVPDQKCGETVKAVIVPKPGETLTLDELQRFLKGRVSPMEMPKLLELRDTLPKSPAGKILRKEIRTT